MCIRNQRMDAELEVEADSKLCPIGLTRAFDGTGPDRRRSRIWCVHLWGEAHRRVAGGRGGCARTRSPAPGQGVCRTKKRRGWKGCTCR